MASRHRVSGSTAAISRCFENELYGASLAVSLAEVEDPTEVADANGIVVAAGSRERLTWGVGPYIDATIFDPENPFRANLGIEGQARYEITPSLIAQGAVRIPVVGNSTTSRVVDVPPTGAAVSGAFGTSPLQPAKRCLCR